MGIMMAKMRTTVTLDADVERLLREAMYRSRKSFKQALNDAVRSGLSSHGVRAKGRRFRVKARAMSLRAGIDPASFNRMADDLEAEAFLEKRARGQA